MVHRLVRLLPIGLSILSACAGPTAFAPRNPGAAFGANPSGGPSRCRVGSGAGNPLVTEWPAAEKANLEALLRQGGVAVEYTGCSMRVLTQCRVPGRYGWLRTTPATDVVEIRGEDELWAKLPLGAASLEGELKRSGKLEVYTQVVGQYRLEGAEVDQVPRENGCGRATHVIGAMSVGAFSMKNDASSSGKAGAEVAKAGSFGAGSERSAGLARSAGDWAVCGQATEDSPHPNCRSPIQVHLWPIAGRAAEEGPPGTVKVDLLSGGAERWDVTYDDQVVCTTPCTKWLHPARPLQLRTREEGAFRSADKVRVTGLGAAASSGSVQLVAHPTRTGEMLTGISIGGVGAMGLMMGGLLSIAGCTDSTTLDHRDLCSAGKTTALVGLVAGAVGAWLIIDALPRVELFPGGPGGMAGAEVTFGPGWIAGSF
jgi:hypothetical protein